MSAPLWRVFVGDSGAVFYGIDEGSDGEEYGTEDIVRRNAAVWKAEGEYTRIEHRETANEPWVEARDEVAETKHQGTLFKE